METSNNTNTKYVNTLDKLESQIVNNSDNQSLVTKKESISDLFCAKICISFFITGVFSIFAICDVYYACTDETCVNQSQSNNNLTIILKSYLLASGIINFIILGIFNIWLFIFDFNIFQPNITSDEVIICLNIYNWLARAFGFAWLILGCVLFWAYTDISTCSQSVHDYLFARFIIGIVFMVMGNFSQDKK
jgi:hypothetical protein